MCSSKNIYIHSLRKDNGNAEEERSKNAKCLKWNLRWGGGFKPKTFHWRGGGGAYVYFLEQPD